MRTTQKISENCLKGNWEPSNHMLRTPNSQWERFKNSLIMKNRGNQKSIVSQKAR